MPDAILRRLLPGTDRPDDPELRRRCGVLAGGGIGHGRIEYLAGLASRFFRIQLDGWLGLAAAGAGAGMPPGDRG